MTDVDSAALEGVDAIFSDIHGRLAKLNNLVGDHEILSCLMKIDDMLRSHSRT